MKQHIHLQGPAVEVESVTSLGAPEVAFGREELAGAVVGLVICTTDLRRQGA